MQHEDELLTERSTTHGDIIDNAVTYAALKKAFWDNALPELVADARMQLPIDMILLKLSRIATGDYSFEDHWKDLAGYSQLGFALSQCPL